MRTWTHFCHLFSGAKYSLYVNGEMEHESAINSHPLTINFSGTVILGQEQDEVEGGFVETEIFRGKLAQYNIWNRQVPLDEIKAMATCSKEYFGDILSVDLHEGVFNGVSIRNITMEELCRNTLEFTIFPLSVDFHTANQFCRRTGSSMFAPDGAASNERLFEEGQDFLDVCLYFIWIDITDEQDEGIWRRSSSGEKVSLTFYENEDANNPSVNCASMQKQKSTWYMVACELAEKRCFPCSSGETTTNGTALSFLRLRGLCFNEKHKQTFEVIGYKNKKPFFHGLYGYTIYFSPSGEWILHQVKKNETVAILRVASFDVYPIGLHLWRLVQPVCDQPANTSRHLGLSTCDDNQFMCSNGDCIARQSRCDAHDDCDDQSDEEMCGTVVIDKNNYRRHKPPQNDSSKGETLFIEAFVTFLRFVNIEDTNNALTIEFEVTLSWRDSRLKYTNLVSTFSQISEHLKKRLWLPALEFPNVEGEKVKNLGEIMSVKKTGKPLPPDINMAKMGKLL